MESTTSDIALDLDALDVEELDPQFEFCTVCGTYRTLQGILVLVNCGCL